MSRCQKDKTNLDFTEARDSEWQWHQLGHMQVCTSLQTDNHTSTPPLSCLQVGCPCGRPTNSVKALKANLSGCITRQTTALNGSTFYRRDAVIEGASYGPVSVSVSVTSRCSIKRDGRLICFLAWKLFSTSPTLCFKEIRVSTKVRILPRKTFSKTLQSENFATAYR